MKTKNKYELFELEFLTFLVPLEIKVHTVYNLKALKKPSYDIKIALFKQNCPPLYMWKRGTQPIVCPCKHTHIQTLYYIYIRIFAKLEFLVEH